MSGSGGSSGGSGGDGDGSAATAAGVAAANAAAANAAAANGSGVTGQAAAAGYGGVGMGGPSGAPAGVSTTTSFGGGQGGTTAGVSGTTGPSGGATGFGVSAGQGTSNAGTGASTGSGASGGGSSGGTAAHGVGGVGASAAASGGPGGTGGGAGTASGGSSFGGIGNNNGFGLGTSGHGNAAALNSNTAVLAYLHALGAGVAPGYGFAGVRGNDPGLAHSQTGLAALGTSPPGVAVSSLGHGAPSISPSVVATLNSLLSGASPAEAHAVVSALRGVGFGGGSPSAQAPSQMSADQLGHTLAALQAPGNGPGAPQGTAQAPAPSAAPQGTAQAPSAPQGLGPPSAPAPPTPQQQAKQQQIAAVLAAMQSMQAAPTTQMGGSQYASQPSPQFVGGQHGWRLLIIDPDGAALDLAVRAKEAGHHVRICIRETPKTEHIGRGLVEIVRDFSPFLHWADLIFNADNTRWMRELDAFRQFGVPIVGPTQETADWELDRSVGVEVLKNHGIDTPHYEEFTDYDKAIAYVKKRNVGLVSKPSGDANKALSYCAKSPADLVYMLQRWKKAGKFKSPFILQDFVGGVEMAVGGWFGPGGFSTGWCENFEFKKLMDGDMGVATGEQGTVLRYVTRSKLARLVLEPLTDALAAADYCGYIDVNCIIDEHGNPWPLEFTMRPGWPTFNIQQAVHTGDPVEWLMDLAMGQDATDLDEHGGDWRRALYSRLSVLAPDEEGSRGRADLRDQPGCSPTSTSAR